VVGEVARRVYGLDVTMTVTSRNQRTVQMSTGERMEEHTIFNIQVRTSLTILKIARIFLRYSRPEQTRKCRRQR